MCICSSLATCLLCLLICGQWHSNGGPGCPGYQSSQSHDVRWGGGAMKDIKAPGAGRPKKKFRGRLSTSYESPGWGGGGQNGFECGGMPPLPPPPLPVPEPLYGV